MPGRPGFVEGARVVAREYLAREYLAREYLYLPGHGPASARNSHPPPPRPRPAMVTIVADRVGRESRDRAPGHHGAVDTP